MRTNVLYNKSMLLLRPPKRQRTILHIDLDAFYAQVEMRDNPALRTKPLVIGSDPAKTHGRGVVATANYVARQFGIHSAQSVAEAKRLAPHTVFIEPDFAKYRAISQQVHDILRSYTHKIEPVALDEAYIDVTDLAMSGVAIAHEIRQKILAATQLTCSVGVSYNKLLAKLGSEYQKPDGLTVIPREKALQFLDQLAIAEFRGVGEKTQAKLAQLQITNGAQLRALSYDALMAHFGKFGEHLYWQARGEHFGEVNWQHERQSYGKEVTYETFLTTETMVDSALRELAQRLVTQLKKRQLSGRTLTLKIRDDQFQTITRSMTLNRLWELDEVIIWRQVQAIFEENMTTPYAIRLLGISLSHLQRRQAENIPLF
jgi:DNA polymerase-4